VGKTRRKSERERWNNKERICLRWLRRTVRAAFSRVAFAMRTEEAELWEERASAGARSGARVLCGAVMAGEEKERGKREERLAGGVVRLSLLHHSLSLSLSPFLTCAHHLDKGMRSTG